MSTRSLIVLLVCLLLLALAYMVAFHWLTVFEDGSWVIQLRIVGCLPDGLCNL